MNAPTHSPCRRRCPPPSGMCDVHGCIGALTGVAQSAVALLEHDATHYAIDSW